MPHTLLNQKPSYIQVAFAADSSNFTHSIALKTPENDPSKIAALFDDITYNKGASVIRMLESWMEVKKPGTFSSGLQSYIQRYKYGNARTEDLWRALDLAYDGASGGNVIENIMDTWIFQPGYPIVTAKWHMHPNQSTSSSSDSSDAAVLELSQAPFDLRRLETDLSCNDHNNVNNKSTWIIPFTYLLVCRVPSTIMLSSSLPSSSSPSTIRHSITLEESKVNLTLTLCDDGTSPLFLANPSRTGFYKTIYPVDILQSLFDGMGFNRDAFLGAADRLGLITDTVSHLLSRYHSTSFTHPSDENNTINVVGTYLKCLQLMRQEMDELVWTGFLEFAWAPLNSAMIHLSSDVPEVYTGFVKFGQGIVDHWISYVQWDPLDGVKQRSRVLKGQFWIVPSDVIEFAVLVGNPQAVNRALGVFEKLVDGSLSSLPPVSVVDAVLLAGVIYQDDGYHQLYELLFKQDHDGNYDPSIVKLPPDSIFTALCKSQREEDQKKTLHLIQKLLKQMSGDGGGGGDDRVGKNNKTAVASVTPVTIIHGIRYISQASRTAPHLVWKFLAKMLLNDEHISFPIMSSKMAKVVEDTIGRMGSDGVKEVEALIDKLGGGKEHHPDTVDRILIILKRGVERANAVLSFANSTWGIETADFFKTLNFY